MLARRGFDIQHLESRLYIHQNPPRIKPGVKLKVARIRVMDPAVSRIIQTEDGGNWNVAVMDRQLEADSLHLLVGYAGGEPVCLCALKVTGRLSRLDDVITHQSFRGRGYGRALIRAVLDYHDRLSHRGEYLYLWASNPTAIRIYEEAGFVELNAGLERWNAWYAPVGRT